jgi:hypothetical protein
MLSLAKHSVAWFLLLSVQNSSTYRVVVLARG